MIFEHVHVRAFGRLADLDTGEDPLPRLVVVHGPNEAGKSSLFVFLASLLYGFYPATRDGNPHTPWNRGDIDGEARVRLEGGERVRVHRRLLSSPWGRIARNGEVDDLRNREVPWASHVSRELFEQVYALTLADLARLEVEAWRTVQDRLLGSLGADDLRPTRSVVDELEADGDGLWRPDRRGKPAADALERRRRELREAAHDARDRDRLLRDRVAELEGLEARIEEAKEERRQREAEHARATVLGPVRARLRRIRTLEARAGDADELAVLPPDPREILARLDGELERVGGDLDVLAERRDRLRERVEGFTAADRKLVGHAEEIRRLVVEAGEVRHARSRLDQLEVRRRTLDRRRDALCRELFGAPCGEVDDDVLQRIRVNEVRERAAGFRDAEGAVASARERVRTLEELRPDPPEGHPAAAVRDGVLAVLGVATAAAGALTDRAILVAAGAVLLVVAGATVALRRVRNRAAARRRRRWKRELDAARASLDGAEDRLDRSRERVREALEGAPLTGELRERPGPRVADGLEKLSELRGDALELEEERRTLGNRIAEVEERLRNVGGDLELDLPPDLVGAAARLEEELRAAERRRDDAAAAGRELDDTVERERLEARREELRSSRNELVARLEELGGDRLEDGLEDAEERLRAGDQARELRSALEREHPDLDELEQRIRRAEAAGEVWTADEADAAAAARRVRELTETIEERVAEAESLRNEIDGLRESRSLADVEGELAGVEEELRELRRRRDRLHLVAGALRLADHRFRERHQPDLLRHASRHLSRITGGRYDRLWLRDGDLGGTLLLRGPDYPHELEVEEPVSDGTRDQVYLALRLAIVDHLDRDREPLPLFIDEAFVKWDPERRTRGFDLLRELSEERQIFVFTCHGSMARSLEKRGARAIRLEGPP